MKFESHQVEAWVIGALLDAESPVVKSNARQLLESSGLVTDDFTSPSQKLAFGAIRAIVDAGGVVDPQTVYASCHGLPGAPGGMLEKLAELASGNQTNAAAFAQHAASLQRLSALRRLTAFHQKQLAKLGERQPDPVKLAGELASYSETFSAQPDMDRTGAQDVIELMDDWEAFSNKTRTPYIPTGIEILDHLIGGWVCNLNVIGGLPSIGKSALIAECIMAALESGVTVGLFGLEDATKWVARRHLARRMDMPVGNVAACELNEWQSNKLTETAGRLHQTLGNLLTYNRSGIDPDRMLAQAKHWVMNKGARLIFVDHGGEVRHNTGTFRDRYDLAVGRSFQQLRDLAVNYRVAVVVLCHFNRETVRQGGVPRMSNFKDSAYIEGAARLALGLWEKDSDKATHLRCTILKRTEGQRDITVAIERDPKHALVKRRGGELIDTRAEAEAES